MIPFLSNSNPFGTFSGEQLAIWLAIVFALLLLVEKGQTVIGRMRGKLPLGGDVDNPIYQRTSERPVNWAELGALQRRVELLEEAMAERQKEITKEIAALRKEGELRATRIMGSIGQGNGAIHEKINGVIEAVAYIKGQMDEAKNTAATAAANAAKKTH